MLRCGRRSQAVSRDLPEIAGPEGGMSHQALAYGMPHLNLADVLLLNEI
jgi:hypothetical protein